MGRKRHKKGEETCFHKIKYDSREDALRFGKKIKRRSRHIEKRGFKPYKCNHCGGWHLGHERKDI